MNQIVEILKDSFIDYAGNKHHFVIAAVSKPYKPEERPCVIETREGNRGIEFFAHNVVRSVHIGVSICSPVDKFDEKIGVLSATGRANKSKGVLYVTEKGKVSTPLVRVLLEQEAEFLKNNPAMYIKGYAEAEEKYKKKNKIEKLEQNFSDIERTIVEKVDKDPRFLDNVQEYLKFMNKCKK